MRWDFALSASFVLECFDGSEVTTREGNELVVQKENCVVEEIKEVELSSRGGKFESVDDMTQIMIVGIQLYSCLSLLARQSLSMLTELPGMVTVFEKFFHLEYSDSYTCNIHHYCICHSQVTAFETLLAQNYNSIISTVAIIGVGIYSTEAGGYNVFDSHSKDMYHNSHRHVYCWKYHPSIN